MLCADGRYVTTGFPPRHTRVRARSSTGSTTLGLRDEFPDIVLLDLGVERGGVTHGRGHRRRGRTADLRRRPRSAVLHRRAVSAEDFFLGGQTRGLACGVVASPEEAFESEHFRARGFQVEVEHEDLGRTFRYPGAPFLAPAAPWRISRRAPHLGEHDHEVFED